MDVGSRDASLPKWVVEHQCSADCTFRARWACRSNVRTIDQNELLLLPRSGLEGLAFVRCLSGGSSSGGGGGG